MYFDNILGLCYIFIKKIQPNILKFPLLKEYPTEKKPIG